MLIETVGVGQDEVEIAKLADVTVVVLVPGMGDDVQAIKAGIMEIADVFVINKADQPGADRLEREIKAIQSLSTRKDGWVPPIVRAVATEGQGIAETLAAVRSFLARAGAKDRAVANWSLRLREMLRERLLEQFANLIFRPPPKKSRRGGRDPYTIIDGWLKQIGSSQFEIDHLGIAVRSLDAALEFYEKQLGFPVGLRETVEQEKVNVAMLPAGGPRIELLEATGPDSVIAKFIEKRGEGLHHVALKVPDLAATVERLKAHGARLLNEPRAGRRRPSLRFRSSIVHRRRFAGTDTRMKTNHRHYRRQRALFHAGLHSARRSDARQPLGQAFGPLRGRTARGPGGRVPCRGTAAAIASRRRS